MGTTKELSVLDAIAAQMAALPGHLGFYYKNLVTGLEYSVRGDEAFLAASVIKLPLYLHVLRQIAAGEMDSGEQLHITAL